MAGIAVKNNLILYHSNTAGYVEGGKAILDPVFKNGYLIRFLQEKKGLEPHWQDGVYNRLVHGEADLTGKMKSFRSYRLHQLRPEVSPEECFLDFEDQIPRHRTPDSSRYGMVYDYQIETDDLEAIYIKSKRELPQRIIGYPISTSDIPELYDRQGSKFYYANHYGFQKIGFIQGQSLNIQGTDHMKGEDVGQRQPIQEMKEVQNMETGWKMKKCRKP